MEKEKKELLGRAIVTAIRETEEVLQSLAEKTRPVAPDNAIGRLSRMDAIGNKSVNEASLRQARTKLTRLKYAQANLDRPGFGLCSECEEEIPFARIMLIPESHLCVRCAEQSEHD